MDKVNWIIIVGLLVGFPATTVGCFLAYQLHKGYLRSAGIQGYQLWQRSAAAGLALMVLTVIFSALAFLMAWSLSWNFIYVNLALHLFFFLPIAVILLTWIFQLHALSHGFEMLVIILVILAVLAGFGWLVFKAVNLISLIFRR